MTINGPDDLIAAKGDDAMAKVLAAAVPFCNSKSNLPVRKGGKDAVLPLSDTAILAVKRYMAEARPMLADFGRINLKHDTLWRIAKGLRDAAPQAASPYLFLGRRQGQRMTRQNIQQRLQAIGKAALGRNISPHQLRHGFGTVLVENGADILDVQALMRHARIETTQIYLHLDLNYLKEKYDASHPSARIANQNPGLFDALPGAEPESTFHPRLPSRPPRLCGLHGTSGHLPNQPQENPQLPSSAA